MIYKSYFQDKLEPPETKPIDKVLCIIEGQSELLFIKKIYELDKAVKIDCLPFLTTVIEMSWGKAPINWHDKANCKFRGGNIQGALTPQPVLESLYKENIDYYKAVLVMFDADVDHEKQVYQAANQKLKNKFGYVLYAEPCFEKEVLSLTFNQNSEGYIEQNYQVLNNSKCRWYKQNWQHIPKEARFHKSKSSNTLLALLKLEDLQGKNSKIDDLVDFINKTFVHKKVSV